MGMTAVVHIADKNPQEKDIQEVFLYLKKIDDRFSTFKKTSEVERINAGQILEKSYSPELKHILKIASETEKETDGYFSVCLDGKLDPSGIVKGYAIFEASNILSQKGYKNFYVEIAGDIEARGLNPEGQKWKVGIQNPFNKQEVVKVVHLSDKGIATSGSYAKGEHIYNPRTGKIAHEIASITVIGSNVQDADRFATAAYAMGENGIQFIEKQKDLEGYMINLKGIATYTSKFEQYLDKL